ncbi:MAG: zinc-ribbon domain-containing protein [Bacillota bacterium]|nr:zinc-ribbon domain-containing protein [Bacillota bacterium]
MNNQFSFCEQCGSKLSENSKFCAACGWKVPLGEQPQENSQNMGAQQQTVDNSQYAQVQQTAAEIPAGAPAFTGSYTTNNQSGNYNQGNAYQNNSYQSNPYQNTPYQNNGYNTYQGRPRKSNAAVIAVAVGVIAVIAVVLFFVLSKSSIKPEDLQGAWNGTLTFTSITGAQMDESTKQEALNRAMDLSIHLNLYKDETTGNADMVIDSSDEVNVPVTYKNGTLKISYKDDTGSLAFEGSVKKSGDEYKISGTVTGEAQGMKLKGKWNATMPVREP